MSTLRTSIALLALASTTAAQFPYVQQPASELQPFISVGANFGFSIDIEGSTAVVGAPTLQAGSPQPGKAWVFERNGATWAWTQFLQPQPVQNGCRFGDSVGISGDTLVVGGAGYQSNRGAVWVFRRTTPTWTLDAVLQASDGAADDWFGYRCAIDGDRVIVGAMLADLPGNPDAGAAYVFERNGPGWSQVAKLTNPAGVQGGLGVAIQGDFAAMTSHATVQVFRRIGGTWTFSQSIPAAQLDASSVAIDQGRLAIGSPFATVGNAFGAGSVDVMRWTGAVWVLEGTLASSAPAFNAGFGHSVGIAGNRIVAGTFAGGASFEFVRSGGQWRETAALEPNVPFVHGDGKSVAVDGPWTVVGDYASGSQAFAGDAWVYRTEADVAVAYCFGDTAAAACPCNNPSAAGTGQGCRNSTGEGGRLTASGSASSSVADLVVTVAHMPARAPVQLAIASQLQAVPFGDGISCLGGPARRYLSTASQAGVASWGPGFSGALVGHPGELRRYQVQYRDAGASPCGTHANTSNALEITFVP